MFEDSGPSRGFKCPWKGCDKAYRRQEHLDRHQATHLGAVHECPQCLKQYSRSDVLARHLVQTHGSQPASVGRPRKAACESCVQSRVACDGVMPRTCSRCHRRGVTCRYRSGVGPGRSASPEQMRRSTLPTPPQEIRPLDVVFASGGVQPQTTPTDPSPGLVAGGSSHIDPLSGPSVFETPPWPPQNMQAPLPTTDDTAWLTELFLSATAPDPAELMTTTIPLGNPLAFDWGFDVLDNDIFGPIATHAPGSPAQPVDNADADPDLVMAVRATEIDGRLDPTDLPDGQPPEGPWPDVYKPHTPDWHLLLPPTEDSASTTDTGQGFLEPWTSVRITEDARLVMKMIAEHAHQSIWPLPDLGNFPSTRALTRCVDLYLRHFAPWLPILDHPRGSFQKDKAAPLVLMAMAALGSTYDRHGLAELGIPLSELVRRQTLFICEHDRRFMFEFSVVQAALLQSVFGVYSGSPKLFHQAEATRSSLVADCKRMHLLDSTVSAAEEMKKRNPLSPPEELGPAIKQDNRRRRLGWSIFLYDAQLACLFGLPSQYPFTDINTALPSGTAESEEIPFLRVLSALLAGARLPKHVGDMGLSCLAYTLYRLCLEANASRALTNDTTLRFPFAQDPRQLLDQLARYSLDSAGPPSALMLSCACLSHHCHLQLIHPTVLETVKVAAGRTGDEPKIAAREALISLFVEHPERRREVFARAAILSSLVNRYTFDTPPEAVWLFDAALCMWAALLPSTPLAAPPSAPTKSVSLDWNLTPAVEQWIRTGEGHLSIVGQGGVDQLSARSVLQAALVRLELQSWGLAKRYRRVLLTLIGDT